MFFLFKLIACLTLLASLTWWIHRGYRAKQKVRRLATKALKTFEKDLERLALAFNAKLEEGEANASQQKLLFIKRFADRPKLATDFFAGELYALVWVELVARESTEGTKSIGTTTKGTALFRWTEGRGGQWIPTDRLLIDITPDEALNQYKRSLTRL